MINDVTADVTDIISEPCGFLFHLYEKYSTTAVRCHWHKTSDCARQQHIKLLSQKTQWFCLSCFCTGVFSNLICNKISTFRIYLTEGNSDLSALIWTKSNNTDLVPLMSCVYTELYSSRSQVAWTCNFLIIIKTHTHTSLKNINSAHSSQAWYIDKQPQPYRHN